MLTSPSDYIPGKELRALGLVKGVCIQPLDDPSNKNIASQTQLIDESIDIAMDKMKHEALKLEADAIISVHIATQTTSSSVIETLVYGTAIEYKSTTDLQQF